MIIYMMQGCETFYLALGWYPTGCRFAGPGVLGPSRGTWPMSVPGVILGVMERMRITKVPGAVFADTLFLIGQAWLKRGAGDVDGASADLAAAMKLVPLEAVEAILFMIEAGELPEPDPVPRWMRGLSSAARPGPESSG